MGDEEKEEEKDGLLSRGVGVHAQPLTQDTPT